MIMENLDNFYLPREYYLKLFMEVNKIGLYFTAFIIFFSDKLLNNQETWG